MGIGQKLLAVMETCRYMPKDGHNSYQNYDYTTAAGLNAKVNAALGEQGLYTQSKVTLLNSRDVTTAKGNQEKYVEVQIEITITDSEDEGSVTFSAIGSGQDAGDKAAAKAQSMAMKYAYITGLCIAMADDPEEDSNTKAYLQDTPRKNNSPAKSNGDNPVVGDCEECGSPVLEKNMVYARKFHNGRMLCYKCQQKLKNGNADVESPF